MSFNEQFVTTHESCPVERVVCGGRRHAYALGLGYIQHSTPTDAMEPLPMDRVGIDGLDGPGRSRRLIHGQSSSGRSRTNFAGTSSTSLQTSRRQFTPQREPETNTLTDGYDSRQLKQLSMRSLHRETVDALRQQNFSHGLSQALAANADEFNHRIWIVDNSGSMQIGDGHKIVTTSDRKVVAQPVSRWEEIQDTVLYHCDMAVLMNSPTYFKLLNHPGPGVGKQEFGVCEPGRNVAQDMRQARTIMKRARPIGTTPLASHIWSVHHSLRRVAPRLRREGKRVVLVIATDGLPTDDEGFAGDDVDEDFLSALRSLEGLPIWLVIRLCTDEVKVTNFYNKLDSIINLPLEVLDDFMSEAREVNRHNKWLNYSLPMHRCRELGYHNRVFDFLDERPLTKGELTSFCSILFGSPMEEIPDPYADWKGFLQYIQSRLVHEDESWDPMRKKNGPWIYIRTLHKIYGKGEKKCAIM